MELTHGNISANLLGLKHVWKGQLKHHTSLAFLPWAHVFGQTAELNSLIATGSSLGIVSNRYVSILAISYVLLMLYS